jgi:hypothetical protein
MYDGGSAMLLAVRGVVMQVLTVVNLPVDVQASAHILKADLESFVPFELENDALLADLDVSGISAAVRSVQSKCTYSENRRLAESAPGPGNFHTAQKSCWWGCADLLRAQRIEKIKFNASLKRDNV